MTLRVRPEAVTDIAEAALWYQARQAELGAALVDEVDAAFARIERGPLRYAAVHGPLRRALVRRFPYAVYFDLDGGDVVVLAVLHQHRDGRVLSRRISTLKDE